MKTVIAAVLLLGASGVAAHAETFTFTGTTSTLNMVVAPVTGGTKPVVAIFGAGTSEGVYAGGGRTTSNSNCATWTVPPGQTFELNGACTYTENNGDKASIVFGCDWANKDQTESNCWGYLSGMGGARQGKTGTMSWRQKVGADGKTGSVSGVGQWN